MSLLKTAFDKASSTFAELNENVPAIQKASDFVVETVSANVPVPILIKGVKAFQTVKHAVLQTKPFDEFIEQPIPDVYSLKLEDIDVSNPFLYKQKKWQSYFKRLRDECPVHYQKSSPFGPFWSVTRYEDIVFVDKNHDLFSAEPAIIIGQTPEGLPAKMFIAMDPPKHDKQRQAVQDVVAPKNLKELESLIRSRTQSVLDELPVSQPFDWVQNVSIELTTRMLATLFDFPYEKRQNLVYWSDVMATFPQATGGPGLSIDEFFDAAIDMTKQFSELWHQKAAQKAAGAPMGYDVMSMLIYSKDTEDMIRKPMEFMGNLALLIIGGNDTTRNSMSGGLYALNLFPNEFVKLKANPGLIPNMVSEIIRWQTPLAYMRRIAKQDVELNGQLIKKGDKVVMWYVSGNRDERAIEQPDEFIIDRKGARNHLSFGFGVHRCMGNRLAELQLRILWEELLARFENIEVLGEPEIVQSNFVRGYGKMMVKLTPKTAG